MRSLFHQIERVAPSNTTVLIQGESGTGKELVAQAIHEHSRRREGPFVAINCAAIPHDLLEAELFGHEKGAYTGAHIRRRGKIEFADGGTVFLDEIGELDLALQAKLLRFLQDHKVERIGGRESIRRRRAGHLRHQCGSHEAHGRGALPRGSVLPSHRRVPAGAGAQGTR